MGSLRYIQAKMQLPVKMPEWQPMTDAQAMESLNKISEERDRMQQAINFNISTVKPKKLY